MGARILRAAAAVLSGLLIVWLAAALLAGQAARHGEAAALGAQARAQATALAGIVSAATVAGRDEAGRAALVADALAKAGRTGDAFRLIQRDGKRLTASTFPADKTAGAAPRRLTLAEKPLFDRTLTLAPQGRLVAVSPAAAVAAAPIMVAGAAVGHVEVERVADPGAAAAPAAPARLWFLLAGLGLIGVAVATWRPGLRGWAGVLVALAAAGLAASDLSDAGQARAEAAATNVAGAAQGFAEAARTAAIASGLPETALPPAGPLAPAALAAQLAPMGTGDALALAGLVAALVAGFVGFGAAARTAAAIKEHATAYTYVAPALIGMLALAFFPFFYGFILSFTDTTLLNQGAPWSDRWVGLSNYAAILGDFRFGGAGEAFNYQNFYWTLGVTVLWTVTNVALGVSIGVAFALLLNIKGLKGVAIYRTLLILPWAIPNYITALTWKGMFHPQFGSINQVIQAFGGQPVQWFDHVGTSFVTGLATNVWLSVPFMMVVALGALQAVDEDMYEAARIDGASPWQRFWHITLPSLRPALLPAVIVSVVWTFNMFNVIYLVSAGQPSGSTEILVTRAYKIAFEEYRYGYAAAYSVVIFLILLAYGVFQIKATAATEANNK
jgi:arabinogalactan oligomer/maltooligosaccharide transport system permease protein